MLQKKEDCNNKSSLLLFFIFFRLEQRRLITLKKATFSKKFFQHVEVIELKPLYQQFLFL